MKSLYSTSLVVLALFASASVAHARPQYFGMLMQVYPEANLNNTTKCLTCHNGRGLNAYGSDFASAYRNLRDFTKAVRSIENLDSDGDTAVNVQEIMTGTNPGIKNR